MGQEGAGCWLEAAGRLAAVNHGSRPPFTHGDDCPCAACGLKLLLDALLWFHDLPVHVWQHLVPEVAQ